MVLCFNHSEFEEEVRIAAGIFDRPITEEDVLHVTRLDLSNFDFLPEDMDTLSTFHNLKALDINIGQTHPSFWHSFVYMEDLCVVCWGDCFDFISFRKMTKLTSLTVSGGDYSGINYLNLDALIPLEHLRYLQLHEFGSIDLLPLASMPQLREFELRYANNPINIDVIGSLSQLEALTIDGLYVKDLNFLDSLPDQLQLEMCGNHVHGGVDPRKWKRFAKHDICEISVQDSPFEYIDLSQVGT